MIILANVLIGLAHVLHAIIYFFNLLILAAVIMSWVSADPRNPLVQFVRNVTDPLFYKVRRYIPPIGMLDISPLVVIFGLMLVDYVIVQSLMDYGQMIRLNSMVKVG